MTQESLQKIPKCIATNFDASSRLKGLPKIPIIVQVLCLFILLIPSKDKNSRGLSEHIEDDEVLENLSELLLR